MPKALSLSALFLTNNMATKKFDDDCCTMATEATCTTIESIDTDCCIRLRRPSMLQRETTIRFSPVIQVKEIVHINDMTPEDIMHTWYQPSDYNAIKRKVGPLIRKVLQCCDDNHGAAREALRGLESKTPKGMKQRKRNRLNAYFAVFEEQEQQKCERRFDANRLAAKCAQATASSQAAAHSMGIKDEMVVKWEQQKLRKQFNTRSLKDMSPTPAVLPPIRCYSMRALSA